MKFIPLKLVCPELKSAVDQCQVIPGSGKCEELRFYIHELYCPYADCDCRLVYLALVDEETDKILAVAVWGWEDLEFYENNLRKISDEGILLDEDSEAERKEYAVDIKVPKLYSHCEDDGVTQVLTDFMSELVESNVDFQDKVKKHYQEFKEVVNSDEFQEWYNDELDDEFDFDDDDPDFDDDDESYEPEKPKRTKTDEDTNGYVFRLDLKGVKPPIWRRIWVPHDYTLTELSDVIIYSMGWFNCHLHSFTIDEVEYQIPDEYSAGFAFFREIEDERKFLIRDVVRKPRQRIHYEYDFGDGWDHLLVFEKMAVMPGNTPRVLKGKRACPPEDCGGIWGYSRILDILDKKEDKIRLSEEEQDLLDWLGGDYDPEHFDLEAHNRRLGSL